MIELIHGVGQRLVQLKEMLEAREGKAEYKENCEAIREEIARLEASTLASEGKPKKAGKPRK